jgi:small-conductance mechanosensitive channel
MIAPIASVLDRAGDSLGDFLPQLAGAFVLLVVGLLVARLVGRLVRRGLLAVGLDEFAARWGIIDTLVQARLQPSLAGLIGAAVRITLSVVAAFAALTLLGLQLLSQSLNEAVLFLPNVLAALALLLAGVVLAGLARDRVDRFAYQMDFAVPLGQFAQITTLAIFALMAAAQIGISADILFIVIAILLAAAAGTFALAFGLGGREVARALNAGRFVRGAFQVGQTISVGQIRGTIVAIEPEATVIGTADGLVRMPNNLLLESMVTIHGAAGPPDQPA